MIQNRYPLWKNIMILAISLVSLVYCLPNFYGEDPSIQISPAKSGIVVDQRTEKLALDAEKLRLLMS